MRRLTVLPLLLAALAAGCGSSDEEPEPLPALASVTFPQRPFIAEVDAPPVPEPEAPERRTERGEPAGRDIAPGAPSDAEVRKALAELYGDDAAAQDDGGLANAVVLSSGQAIAPPDAPPAVQRIVAAANKVARLPYVYGGGHSRGEGLFVDSAYDCSGSISFALANAGLIDRPMTSGEYMRWGEPGQGEWVTIYANEEHAFMVVGGARFDTVGLRETGSRWQRPFRSIRGFTAVHPPGL
jgi:cell wall-associated NlpC family hydrolase